MTLRTGIDAKCRLALNQLLKTGLLCLGMATLSMGQTPAYHALVKQADSLYEAKAYGSSAAVYTQAFKANKWLGIVDDRYNAARSWALAGNVDSSFA